MKSSVSHSLLSICNGSKADARPESALVESWHSEEREMQLSYKAVSGPCTRDAANALSKVGRRLPKNSPSLRRSVKIGLLQRQKRPASRAQEIEPRRFAAGTRGFPSLAR